jgi:hypothetical protein
LRLQPKPAGHCYAVTRRPITTDTDEWTAKGRAAQFDRSVTAAWPDTFAVACARRRGRAEFGRATAVGHVSKAARP